MRLKIIGANFIVVLVCGLAGYLLVRSSLKSYFEQEVEGSLSRDQSLFEDSRMLAGRLLEDLVRQRARGQSAVAVFTAPAGSDDRRRAAFVEAQAMSAALEDRGQMGRRPELVALTDERGRIISRNVDPNAHFMRDLGTEFPSIRFALRGDPITDIWQFDALLLDIAAAPIVRDNGVIGALVVGFDISNGQARAEKARFAKEIGYFTKGRLYSTSLEGAGPGGGDSSPAREMAKAVTPALATAIQQRSASNRFPVAIAGSDYVAIAAPLPGQRYNHDAGYVMLASVTQALSPVGATTSVLICTILALIGVAVMGLLLSNHFLKPIEQIEDGVLRVINGDVNHRLEIESPEVGGLAYRINQLINTLTGVEEGDEEGGAGGEEGAPPRPQTGAGAGGGAAARPAAGEWTDNLAVGDAAPAGGPAADPAALAAEAPAAYYARVFKEYVDAKKQLGERVEHITQDKFLEKLRSNEQALAKKYGVGSVRFQVTVSGGQVSLRPVPLR
ncbi:MAG: methyl-accepting chemotaxis protein [Deltaproteobacteria bacterium]|nr:methyl-accepting chemotaxis protein [Deltaproteobacteria bacterium]